MDAAQLSCCGSHDRLCGRLPSVTARQNNILCKMSDRDLFMSVFDDFVFFMNIQCIGVFRAECLT